MLVSLVNILVKLLNICKYSWNSHPPAGGYIAFCGISPCSFHKANIQYILEGLLFELNCIVPNSSPSVRCPFVFPHPRWRRFAIRVLQTPDFQLIRIRQSQNIPFHLSGCLGLKIHHPARYGFRSARSDRGYQSPA